jgi:hypothetical protein
MRRRESAGERAHVGEFARSASSGTRDDARQPRRLGLWTGSTGGSNPLCPDDDPAVGDIAGRLAIGTLITPMSLLPWVPTTRSAGYCPTPPLEAIRFLDSEARRSSGNLKNAELGRQRANETRRAKAASRAADLAPLIAAIRAEGVTTATAIAKALNDRGIPTTRGGHWQAVQVQRLLRAAGSAGGC